MSLLNAIAPRLSRRRLLLKIFRDFLYRPSSLFGRLAATNFYNAKICNSLRIHCTVCGQDGGMTYDFPDVRLRKSHGIGLLRETLSCNTCGATMRDREVAFGLLRVISEYSDCDAADLRTLRQRPPRDLRILDTDSFSAINRVLRGMPGYQHSQFRTDLHNGAHLPDGSVNVNLLEIPFQEHTFNIVMTSDVMEHVDDDEQAHREIFRCLVPGGTYVFTVPYDPTLVSTRTLTQATGISGMRFILDKHVHGDPHSSSGIIAHRIYGQQLLNDLRVMGYEVCFEHIDNPTAGIFGGDLFLARKKV